MPHSLYLGSGIVQPRLREYDTKHGLLPTEYSGDQDGEENVDKGYYVPSLKAIRHSLKVSSVELATALFTFALFVNSAILIVAGISLYNNPNAPDADIFSIHKLLTDSISPAAGTIFALALLLSGVSAGIVCTIAGQMVSEGALNWRLRPWLRRLVTRSISITPSIIIAGAVGRKGLNEANASQVVLSVILPFVTAPLIYFTCMNKYMTIQPGAARYLVPSGQGGGRVGGTQPLPAGEHHTGLVKMANAWYTVVFAVLVWIIITGMNVANLVLLGRGD
jgi:metal iron transporter